MTPLSERVIALTDQPGLAGWNKSRRYSRRKGLPIHSFALPPLRMARVHTLALCANPLMRRTCGLCFHCTRRPFALRAMSELTVTVKNEGDIKDKDTTAAESIAKATGTKFGEDAVAQVMKKYDVNGDGVFDIAEVRQIVNDIMAQQGQNKQLKKYVILLSLIMFAMCFAMFGVSLVAGMALKDSKVVGGSTMTALNGEAMRVDSVESNVALFDLPAVDTASLAKMKDIVFFADLSTLVGTGAWAEATYQVGGVYKINNDVATIKTTSGEAITLRRAAQSGELLMNGVSYPISDVCAGACSAGARKLSTAPTTASPVVVLGKRKLGFYSALMTSGNFMMMQAGAF